MSSLHGRLDDPDAWIASIPVDLYRDVDARVERECDAVPVGRTTYDEMHAYWPGAESERRPIGENTALPEAAWEINQRVARKMSSYQKLVVTRGGRAEPLAWNDARLVVAPRGERLVRFVAHLKARPGRDVHLAGGAELARSFARLGLVDEYRLHVHPVLSRGAALFDAVEGKRPMELLGATTCGGGVVSLRYRAGAAG